MLTSKLRLFSLTLAIIAPTCPKVITVVLSVNAISCLVTFTVWVIPLPLAPTKVTDPEIDT